jgi:diacylglycerol kinase (ATP)
MSIQVILNPYANRWQAQTQIEIVTAALSQLSRPFHLNPTSRPHEAVALAETAVRNGCEMVVAAGGDGTINEVITGILHATPEGAATLPFGIIPLGSANDFSQMAGLPVTIADSVALMGGGQTRPVDVGVVVVGEGDAARRHYFLNNSAVGMEPMVTLENIKMKRLRGELRYLVALVRALRRLRAWQMEITGDGLTYSGPVYLLSICNGPRTGGFMMAPTAVIDDGRFDLVFAPEVAKITVLAILLRLLRGTHIAHPAVTYSRFTQLSLRSQPGTPIHVDGEVIGEAETAVEYRVIPGKLTLICAKQET